MSKTLNILAPVLGGTALVLGVAYGLNTRDYRSAEIEAVRSQAAAAQAEAALAEARIGSVTEGFEARVAEAEAEAADLRERIAALEADLAERQDALDAAAAAPLAPAPEVIEVAAAASNPFGDADRGAEVFRQCVACHQVGEGAENRTGPHLNGVFGRRAGAIEDFRYSQSMERAYGDGLVWDVERLDAYIENPRVLITGTRMSFDGVKDADARHDLLAFLRQYSDNPQNIPESAPTAAPREVNLSPEILAIVGDHEYGEYLSSECLTCHQKDGTDEGIPSIVYWPEEDFVVAMHAYKQKLRPHPVMQMMASRLSDEEIAALAAYFANVD
jgi:cytochrome c